MTLRLASRSLLLLGLLFATVGCATGPKVGHVSGDVYTSPLDNFSVPIPLPAGYGRTIQDDVKYDEAFGDEGYVSFFNDFGRLWRIDYTELKEHSDSVRETPEQVEGLLRKAFHEGILANIRTLRPESTSWATGFVGSGYPRAYFGVISIPQGSTLVKANMLGLSTGERLDTERAYLLFLHEGFFYGLSTADAEWGNAPTEQDGRPSPERIAKWQRELEGFRARIQYRNLRKAP